MSWLGLQTMQADTRELISYCDALQSVLAGYGDEAKPSSGGSVLHRLTGNIKAKHETQRLLQSHDPASGGGNELVSWTSDASVDYSEWEEGEEEEEQEEGEERCSPEEDEQTRQHVGNHCNESKKEGGQGEHMLSDDETEESPTGTQEQEDICSGLLTPTRWTSG